MLFQKTEVPYRCSAGGFPPKSPEKKFSEYICGPMPLHLKEEQHLLAQTAAGNASAYRQLFDAYYGMVARIAWKYVRDESLAFDVAQEVFSEIWQRAGKIQLEFALSAYLRRMAISYALQTLKKQRRLQFDGDDLPTVEEPSTAPLPDQLVIAHELTEQVNSLVAALPDKCRTIWLLCREEGKSQQEAAALLDISPKTVENQMTIALRKIRAGLAQWNE